MVSRCTSPSPSRPRSSSRWSPAPIAACACRFYALLRVLHAAAPVLPLFSASRAARMLRPSWGSGPKGVPMDRDRTKVNANEDEQRASRTKEHPARPEPEPDKMEGPGGQREAKAEEDARNKTTRRGER